VEDASLAYPRPARPVVVDLAIGDLPALLAGAVDAPLDVGRQRIEQKVRAPQPKLRLPVERFADAAGRIVGLAHRAEPGRDVDGITVARVHVMRRRRGCEGGAGERHEIRDCRPTYGDAQWLWHMLPSACCPYCLPSLAGRVFETVHQPLDDRIE